MSAALSKNQNQRAIGLGLLALGGLLIFLISSREQTEKVTHSTRPAPKETVVKLAPLKAAIIRRDRDYWPQEAHPISMRHRDLLPSREFVDYPDLRSDENAVWIAQFGGPLGTDDIENLKRGGIDVIMASVANSFHVRATQLNLKAASAHSVPALLGWCRLTAQDRILPQVLSTLEKQAGEWHVRIEAYPGFDLNVVAQSIRAAGGNILAADPPLTAAMKDVVRGIEVSIGGREQLEKMAGIPGVYAIGLPQPRKRATNEDAAAASNISVVQAAPYNLTGATVTVLVRDEAQVFGHPDYNSRLVLGPDVVAEASSVHSTHVAGTIGGTGLSDVSALATGMARGCVLISFDLNGDDVNEPLQGKSNFGAVVSNHSYGFVTGWDSGTFNNNQSAFGTYSSFARNWDSIVRSDGLIMIKAVGNDRNDSGPGFPHDGTLASDFEYYDTTDSSSTSKNTLTVGATADAAIAGTPSAVSMVLPASSSGPTDDGRIRPEIVANGDNVNSCNNSVVVGDEYVRLTGTSMACAVVSGATAIFLERYRQVYGSSANFTPHFLRSVYAQTATDFGRPGPDHLHGFGMLDLAAAVSLFDTDNGMGTRIANRSLSAATPERFFVINSDGVTPIKATLCWTDEAGDMLAAKTIVNDLDLRLVQVSDQAVFFPYVLNRLAPEQPATNALNTVDTIEQIVFQPPAAGSYLIAVRAGTLATTTDFTISSSHDMSETVPPVAVIHASTTSGMPPLTVTFDGLQSTDADGSVVRYLWSFGDGNTNEGALLQHSYNAGSFTATLKVIDDKGASASTTIVIAVANKSPNAAIAVSPESGDAPLAALLSSLGSSDPDGTIVDYDWDFGDGTIGSGAQVSHTYTAPGLYFAELTVRDNGNATAARSAPVLVGKALATSSARFGLNFQKLSYDRFTYMTKTFPVVENYNVDGLTGVIGIGHAQYGFRLDAKGRYKVAPLSVTLTPSRKQFKFTLSRASLIEGLAMTGATSRDVKNLIIKVPFVVSLSNGQVLGSTGLQFSYTAKQGKTGSGRLFVP
jgi:PKD repeat protein